MDEYKLVNATKLDNDLQSICDTIRAIENSEFVDMQIPFPNGFKQAITTTCENRYWDGHRDGHTEGANRGYGQGTYYAAEQAQKFGQKTNYGYWKHTQDITDLKIPYPMAPTVCDHMFNGTTTSDGSVIDLSEFDIDFSKCTSFSYWINGSAIGKIGTLDTTSASSLKNLFYNAGSLTTVDHLILKEDGSQTLGSSVFQNAQYLQNINKITGKFGQSFTLYQTYRLSHDTLVRIFEALYDYSGTTTNPTLNIVMGDFTDEAELTEEEIQIATSKGWSVT